MKEHYKKENLEKVIKESFSLAEALRKIGLADVGSNFATLKKYISKYGLDTSHFTGQLWSKGKTGYDDIRLSRVNIDDVLSNKSPIKSYNLRAKLFSLGLKEEKCEVCGCGKEWQGKPITLEIHHIDGNHYNNNFDNLQILCPNCHSQTKNFRSSNKKAERPIYEIKENKLEKTCEYCGKHFHAEKEKNRFCSRECYENSIKDNILISKEELIKLLGENKTPTEIGKIKNTTRQNINRYIKKYGIKKGIQK